MASAVESSSPSGLLSFLNNGVLPLKDVITNTQSHKFTPVTKRNIGYIVGAVLFNERNQVLMVQEAKASCRGQWYLPAGRLEKGENLVDGVKREVLEEAGLTFDPTTLLCVEAQGPLWYRFTFTGKVTGGKLKTLAEQDEESLQARWYPVDEILVRPIDLRAYDIQDLIRIGVNYREDQNGVKHPPTLPIFTPLDSVVFRLVLVFRKPASEGTSAFDMWYLKTCEPDLNFPAVAVCPQDSVIQVALMRLMLELFEQEVTFQGKGLISVEHSGIPTGTDGICFNVLCEVESKAGSRDDGPPTTKTDKFTWQLCSEKVNSCLLRKLDMQSILPFIMLDIPTRRLFPYTLR